MTDNKKLIIAELVNRYCKGAYTHSYVFGFASGGLVYAVQVDDARTILTAITSVESRTGKGYVLKYRPNSSQVALILANAARVEILGTTEWLETVKAEFKNNRGDAFEYYACKRWGAIQQENRSLNFTKGGDFYTVDGRHFQAKYGARTGAATFTDELTLSHLGL